MLSNLLDQDEHILKVEPVLNRNRTGLLNDRTIFPLFDVGGWILDNESANGNEEARCKVVLLQ